MRLIPNQRGLFQIPEEVAYFNCASLAPQMRPVRAAAKQALDGRAAPWTVRSADWFSDVEKLRALFGRLVKGDAEGVALTNATSYGLAIAAANLEAGHGDRVLLLSEDYPSTVYTWRAFARRTGAEILTAERGEGRNWTDAILELLDERVRVVSVPNVHWTDGALIDLARVGERAREVGAAFVVDATQSLGTMPLDVNVLQPDYLVSSGYKWLMGPFSVGYMWMSEAHRSGQPIEENWINRAGSEDFAGLTDYTDEYQPGARRFDVGQRTSFVLTPMAIAALTKILEWGVDGIAATLSEITGQIEAAARDLGLDPLAAAERGPHMLGIKLPRAELEPAAAKMAAAGVYVGVRGPSIRVSPHLYTTDTDVGRLLGALAAAREDT